VLTADHVLAAAESWYPDRSPMELLAVLRAEQERFVPTWLSARATREELPTALVAELAAARERAERIRQLGQRLRAAVPAARTVKGPALADRYPAGLARLMADVDVVAADAGAVWRVAAAAAADSGAEVRGVSTFPVPEPGRRGLLVGMRMPERFALEHPLHLDICTHVLVGNGSTVPARAWIGRPGDELEPAAHLLLIAAKPLERPYGLKQVVDAAVLADALGPAGVARARQLAGPLRPELRAVLDLAARHGLPVPEPPVGAGEARLARVGRAARFAAANRRRPLRASLRVLQHTEVVDPARSRGRRRVWRAVDRRLPVLSPARDGLFRFGLPVTVQGATDRPLLRTPFGDYLLVTGAQVTEDWLDDGLVPVGAVPDG
jgi:hypothetical protein